MKRQHLLVLASTYPRWSGDHEPGFVHELCRRLTTRFRVTVVVPDAPGADANGLLDGVEVIRYRYAPRRLQTLVNDGGILANLKRYPWKWTLLPTFFVGMLYGAWRASRRERVGVIHAHWLVPQGLAAVLIAMVGKNAPRVVVTCHGADLHALGSGPMRALKAFAARRAATVTVVGSAMLEKVAALGVEASSMVVRPMGVDQQRFSPDARARRSASGLLFVGRLVEKKGARHLLDAMPRVLESVPDAHLKIAGFGPEEAVLRRQAERLGIAGKVEFLGAVPQERLPALYREAAALVAPFVEAGDGDQEGLGLVLVEALSCGCPVVTTAIPAVKEVFGGEWPASCATPGSAESLAAEILALLRDGEGARAAVAASLPALRRRFDWDVVADGYAELLSSIGSR